MIRKMGPQPVAVDRIVRGCERADPDAAVGGFLPQQGQIFAVILDAVGSMRNPGITGGVNDVSALVAQGIIIAGALLGEVPAEVNTGEASPGRGFALALFFGRQAGGNRKRMLPDPDG